MRMMHQPSQLFCLLSSLFCPLTSWSRNSLVFFGDGVGKLPGEYHIELDETVKPVQHPSRRVPVAIRERLQETLEDLESREIVARVTTPTPWISFNGCSAKAKWYLIRICLYPKDLNRALQRENYPMPTIEEVASRLHGAKVFTVLDVACGVLACFSKREHLSNSKKLCLCHRYSIITTCERRLRSNVTHLNMVLVLCYFKVGSLRCMLCEPLRALDPHGKTMHRLRRNFWRYSFPVRNLMLTLILWP